MPEKMFPHLKLLCWLFMGPLLVLSNSKETVFGVVGAHNQQFFLHVQMRKNTKTTKHVCSSPISMGIMLCFIYDECHE
jgi:hypothetical protein